MQFESIEVYTLPLIPTCWPAELGYLVNIVGIIEQVTWSHQLNSLFPESLPIAIGTGSLKEVFKR